MIVSLYSKSKKRIHEILEAPASKYSLSWFFDLFLAIIILLNVLAIMLESVNTIKATYGNIFEIFETYTVVFFSIEYILRVWSVTEDKKHKHPFFGRLKYMFSLVSIIDLLAILPYYISVWQINTQFIRVLWLLRLFRLFKAAPYVRALVLIGTVIRKRKEQLILSYVFLLVLLILVSCLMYFIENAGQPNKFSSIPQTMWWAVSTLTTVGYGDMVPITPLGQFFGGLIAIIGIAFFALPAGILASGFSQELRIQYDSEKIVCPDCGHHFNPGHEH